MSEKIQKVLAHAGLASRREAETWISQGRISVNGEIIRKPGLRVDPEQDHIRVDGRRIKRAAASVYYLLNKPTGYLTTSRDPEGRPIVMDLMKAVRQRVFPVGRLDFNTSGLLLFTNDGELADRLMRPASSCPKVYHVKVRGVPEPATLKKVSSGVVIDGRKTLPCGVRRLRGSGNSWLEVVLKEGRRNQIRTMLRRVGHPVSKLKRVAIGPIKDSTLALGRHRALTAGEIRRLRQSVT